MGRRLSAETRRKNAERAAKARELLRQDPVAWAAHLADKVFREKARLEKLRLDPVKWAARLQNQKEFREKPSSKERKRELAREDYALTKDLVSVYRHHDYYDFPERSRTRQYGMIFAEGQTVAGMFAEQEGICAICPRELEPPMTVSGKGSRVVKRPANEANVDHCHATGKVRAILCKTCNLMLGYASDDPEILRSAIAYIEKHKGK